MNVSNSTRFEAQHADLLDEALLQAVRALYDAPPPPITHRDCGGEAPRLAYYQRTS